jgi:3-oxoacyl-[acyl-carrier-protein] synthase-3
MNNSICTIITGTGSYVPSRIIKNEAFLTNEFFDADGNNFEMSNEEIISKFEAITGIKERCYIEDNLVASDIAYLAAENAIKKAGINRETLDYIIVAHDFGDIKVNSKQTNILPSLASRVKNKLAIKNPKTIAYDTIFGCPGWLQGIIQAHYYIKSGDAKRILVIGVDTLSRIYDPHDRDCMIYADGAGATILEGVQSTEPVGILSHMTRTDTDGQAYNLWLGKSNNSNLKGNELLLKMNGRKLYNYALSTVPKLVKECLEKAGVMISDVNKILIHQANAKMDEAILKRVFLLYNELKMPKNIMPMTIAKLGNSSVATVPTLLDFILSGKMPGHELKSGQIAVMTSVGAGMNINCIVYKFPDNQN